MTIAALRQALEARPGTKVAIIGRALVQQLFETDELAIETRSYEVPRDGIAEEIQEGRLPEEGVEPEASYALPRMTLRAAPHVLVLPASFTDIEGIGSGGFVLLSR